MQTSGEWSILKDVIVKKINMEPKVYISIYAVDGGIEVKTSPEKFAVSVDEAIEFLEKYKEQNKYNHLSEVE